MLGSIKRGREKRGSVFGAAPRLSTLAEIGKERIRRVIARMRKDQRPNEDLGFRVFKQCESSFRAGPDPDAFIRAGRLIVDPLKPGWEPLAVVWEIALSEGLPLTSQIRRGEKRKGRQRQTVYAVIDATPNQEQALMVCLDAVVYPWLPSAFRLQPHNVLICRDCAISEKAGHKLESRCKLLVF